jgi:thiol-disulfide isomerase/thioredoxin
MNFNDLKQKVSKSVGNTKSLMIICLVFIFLLVAIFIYRKFVSGRSTKDGYVANNEYNTAPVGLESVDIYFFYTEWCPHCKTAKPIWFDFKKEMEGESVNGVRLNFFEVDCDKDTATSDKFKVKGFPTIKMLKGTQIIEYDAKPNRENLHEFVKATLAN